MKKKLLKGLSWLLLGYLALVALRFLYLEVGHIRGEDLTFESRFRYEDTMMKEKMAQERVVQMAMPSVVRNYASVKFRGAQEEVSAEQKYEKIGSLSAMTAKYEEDQKKAREVIKAHNALIQEESVNNDGELSRLYLTIGVPPGEFETTVDDLKRIGKLQNFEITKTDKTNDFLQLKTKRASLEKTRDALSVLKAQGGKIEELVKLEQEILSLEGKIQEFGVQLGQFDKVNEFCTVRFTLVETKPEAAKHTPHFTYLMASIEWASTIYLLWLGIACAGLVATVLLLSIIEKSKLFRTEA
jgi:hypothetical protein